MTGDKQTRASASSSTRQMAGRTIITPEKALTHENCEEFERKMESLLRTNKSIVIIDCKKIPFFDSSGLETLVRIHQKLKDMGGTLKIANLDKVCRDILLATRLVNLFYIYEDLHTAVTSRS
ncbi:MAG: STAS domain-containing protein [Desulfobacteraceae bacterium]|nr:STAS domain-containing protein [Desulfobacteraceae bacterium]